MRRIMLALVFISAACGNLSAQGSSTFHVFPQMADGLDTFSSGYVSTMFVTNTANVASTCQIIYYGAGLGSRFPTSTFTLAASGGFISFNSNIASGTSFAPLVTGYATMSCSQPVTANVGYSYVTPTAILAGATVFSSPATSRAQLLFFPGTRLAFAVANDTNSAGTYQLTLLNSSGVSIGTATLNVPSRSNKPQFVDELMAVPANFNGAVVIASAPGSGPFSVVGLIFSGNVFFSQPAAIF